MNQQTSSVFVSVVGKPNVGKSSIVNRLVGEKVAIVTPKPQTTRNRLTGILTQGPVQYVFIDTPGFHHPRTKLGERMAKAAKDSVSDGDVVLMVFEPFKTLSEMEEQLVQALKDSQVPAVAVINKMDLVKNKQQLEEKEQQIKQLDVFSAILQVSAATGNGCEQLLEMLNSFAAPGPHYYSEDDYTQQTEKELIAEIVREKLLLFMQEEIPHGTAVEVERFKVREDQAITDIDVAIVCEKKSHKGMIIGKGGQMLKKIASSARLEIETLLQGKVFLQCWVKVRDDWRDNDRQLDSLGFR